MRTLRVGLRLSAPLCAAEVLRFATAHASDSTEAATSDIASLVAALPT